MEAIQTQEQRRPIENISTVPTEFTLANQQGVYENLNQFFNDQDKDQKTVLETREVLGDSAKELTDEEVYNLTSEVQFLIDTWLEEFERKIFDGRTLTEMLHLNTK